jgi:glutaredoxin
MVRIRNALLLVVSLAVAFGVGYGAPRLATAARDRWFPEPPFTTGDFSAVRAEAGSDVVLFATSTCPYCAKARHLLDTRKVDYRAVLIDASEAASRRFHDLGGTVVPLLFVGDRRIAGYREDVIVASLDARLVPSGAPQGAPIAKE